MSKSRLAVIEGGGARERISSEILNEILKPDFNQARVDALLAQLMASQRPALELVASNAEGLLESASPGVPQRSEGDTQ